MTSGAATPEDGARKTLGPALGILLGGAESAEPPRSLLPSAQTGVISRLSTNAALYPGLNPPTQPLKQVFFWLFFLERTNKIDKLSASLTEVGRKKKKGKKGKRGKKLVMSKLIKAQIYDKHFKKLLWVTNVNM